MYRPTSYSTVVRSSSKPLEPSAFCTKILLVTNTHMLGIVQLFHTREKALLSRVLVLVRYTCAAILCSCNRMIRWIEFAATILVLLQFIYKPTQCLQCYHVPDCYARQLVWLEREATVAHFDRVNLAAACCSGSRGRCWSCRGWSLRS